MGKSKKPKGLSAKAAGALHQVAGEVTVMRDELTKGQRERVDQLLLDRLADPDRCSAS
jgi:hypothetical protein